MEGLKQTVLYGQSLRCLIIGKRITIMLRCPLTFHSPQTIYQFLRTNVGPLYITLKAGQAIIYFPKPELAQTALQKYNNANIAGLPLTLSPYRQGDLDQPTTQPIPPPQLQQPLPPPPPLSQFTQLIEDSLKVTNPDDPIESATKRNRKEIMEFVNAFNPLLQAAEKRRNQIRTSAYADAQQQLKKIQEFGRFYEQGLNGITKALKLQMKILRRSCTKFGAQDSVIDIQPNIQITQPNPSALTALSFKTKLHYINTEISGLKRIAPLNEEQFVCTLQNNQLGKLLYFRTDEEHPIMSHEIKQGAYGLTVLDQHILVGTSHGNISFFSTENINQRQTTLRLHSGPIFDIVKLGHRNHGYNIVTLGWQNPLKIWSVNPEKITEEDTTLFFQQSINIPSPIPGKSITSIGVVVPNQHLTYSTHFNLYLHDCPTNKIIYTHQCHGQILKVIALNDHSIAAANQKYLSFIDTRNNANTLNYNIKKDIKTIAALNEHAVFYGCLDGEVGVVDRRSTATHWRNTTNHKHKIYDICRVKDMVVSGDSTGLIVSWTPKELNQ